MRHIKKAASYSMVGGLGLAVVASLQGCAPDAPEAPAPDQQQQEDIGQLEQDLQNQNYFLVISQTSANPDKYELAERYPTEGATRAVLKTLDGKERVLSNEELTKLAKAEADKVDAGTSNLTKEASASSGGGLSLGEMILASAAGSLIGGMIANKLANNANAKARTRASTRPAASVSSANNRARSAPRANAKPKKGFFGGSSSNRSSSRTGSFGG
ncbi:MAG: hypothetical protein ACPG47_04135 [Leucothrix sp.]